MQLTIVTRMSALAMWQAQHIRTQLLSFHPQLEIKIKGIKTQGDRQLDQPLYKIGGKSLFVKELEEVLLAKQADIAVHSLKDVPAVFPEGLMLGAICQRDHPFDAWVCPQGYDWQDLPAGSQVGTSSLRRIVQLKRLRPDLVYTPLRGNIDTRLRKCQQGEWDAIVLAAAGLRRLGLRQHIQTYFSPDVLLPAVGQGALGIECRREDEQIQNWLAVLDHPPTRACVMAERAMNEALGGNCHVPVAGFAQWVGEELTLTGRVGNPQTLALLEAQATGLPTDPIRLGQEVAQALLAQGAQKIITELLPS